MITVSSIIGAFLTSFLSKKIDSVRASIISTMVLSGIFYLIFPQKIEIYLYVIYGASFIGMTTVRFNKYLLVLSSLIYSLFYTYLAGYLPEVGGSLGFNAFISVCVSLLLVKIFKELKKTLT